MVEEGRNHWGVLLLAHGAPDSLADVPEFLLHVRSGRKLPAAAVQEIVERYSRIGGGSPLLRLTNQQADALAEILGRPVYVGMRNWKPFIAESIGQIRADGLNRVVAVCLAPQNSRTSVGLYRARTFEAVEKTAPGLDVDFVESWHDHPGLIQAFVERLRAALDRAEADAGEPVPVIFTAHSVPARTIASEAGTNGDPYDRQVRETAALVARALSLSSYRVAYQSQGMTAEPWLGPKVESEINALAREGHHHVVIAPIGFVSDHVEILYDVDVVFREHAQRQGMALWRSESLNDSPLFIQALASIVTDRIRP